MKTFLSSGLGTSAKVVEDIKSVVVYDDDGVILAAMWERDDGTIALTRAGEPDFESLVSQMGFDKRGDVRLVTL